MIQQEKDMVNKTGYLCACQSKDKIIINSLGNEPKEPPKQNVEDPKTKPRIALESLEVLENLCKELNLPSPIATI